MTSSRPVRTGTRVLGAAVLLALLLIGLPVRAGAQEAPSDDPAREVLAVVSPIVSPVCAASGTATLLVPVVSGLIAEQVGEVPIPLSELLLDGLSPAFVVCAELPGAPGSRCQLDDQIAGIWPQEIGQFVSPPGVLGNLTDTVAAALAVLGLPPQAALQEALVCAVPESNADNTPPPLPPPTPPPAVSPGIDPPSGLGAVAAPSVGGGFSSPDLGAPGPSSAPTVTQPSTAPTGPPAVLAAISRRVPGGLLGLQIMAAVLLALFLGSSWATSLRLARSDRP